MKSYIKIDYLSVYVIYIYIAKMVGQNYAITITRINDDKWINYENKALK